MLKTNPVNPVLFFYSVCTSTVLIPAANKSKIALLSSP